MDSSREIATFSQHFQAKDRLLKGLHAEGEKRRQAREKLAAHRAKIAAGERPSVGDRNDSFLVKWTDRLERAESRIAEYEAELRHLNTHTPSMED